MRRLLAAVAALAVLAPLARAANPPAGMVTLHARNQQWVEELTWCGDGDVEVKYQDVTVKCDRVEVDLKTMHMEANGNIVFDQGETRLACDRMSFDLEKKVGTMYVVKGFFPPSYYFRGEEMEKLDETHWRFHHGVFTSCNLDADSSPPWSINVRDAVMELEGYGHFRGVTLRTNGVPFFYTPRLLWPMKRDRAAGFLVPSVGYNDRYGAYLGNAFYWPVSRSFDTTTYLDWWSKGYFGIGQEFRLTPADNASGQVVGSLVRDSDNHTWQWKATGNYSQLFPEGYALRSELLSMSDIDFFQKFERTFDQNSLRSFFSHVTLSRTWGPQAFNLRLESRETFFTSATGTGTTGLTLERKPELEYRLASTRIAQTPLYLSMVGVADELRMDRSATQRGRYGRFDLFPTVSLLTPGLPWLSVTPSVGARLTYYTSTYDQQQNLVPDPLTRHYFTAGLSLVGPSFSRVWNRADGTRVKHLIEPRVEYAYVSNPGDLSRIPVFDEKDSVIVTNKIRAILSNHILLKTKAGSREIAVLEIAQEYSLSDPLTFARPPLPASKRGPLSISARLLPAQQMSFDARADFDSVTRKLMSTALSANVFAGPANVNLTWYSSLNSITGEVLSSQTRIGAAYQPQKSPFRIETQIAYDIHQRMLLEERYILRWKGSCWSAYAEIRDYRILPYTTRDYRIAIDFTGLGTFLDIRGGLDSLGL